VEHACFSFDDERAVLGADIGRAETELETLARLEHEDWMKERIQQGWKPGLQRDRARLIHDLLFDWYDPQLKEQARQQTRQIILNWPLLLARVDLQIYRRREPG
jgi:hypothetical protein